MPRWYVKELGYGTPPVSEEQLQKLVENGVVDRTALVRSEDQSKWIPANKIEGLFVDKTKACPFCGESILDVAVKCKHCGEFLDGRQTAQTIVERQRLPKRNPGVAAVMSFLIPGLGQLYKGQIFNGILWCIVTFVGYALFIVPGLILHVFCICGAASGDPYEGVE